MSIALFRRIALSMPEAIESKHMGHPDFRVNNRIFATLFTPRDESGADLDWLWGMVKLTPQQQRKFVADHPKVFEPVSGGWGRGGATQVRLKPSPGRTVLHRAIETAWRNTAPKRLVDSHGPV